ncbi:hypothetical protein F5X68DRAFT_145032 [Plectosphaerella plurivora]|uniref:Uncharacterized protein n=1 Tax=Plectosphaerella plurivora TaxID=936078 RepID=A0A9P8V0E1_9PEZI|nr:hypothetical protein F5X68DRAFT_145032 [Plectosphaerella plurivora]
MTRHTIIAAGIAAITLAQSNDDHDQNPQVDIASCQALECTPPEGSICSGSDLPGPPIGIGMAPEAITSTPFSESLSFTLIDGLNENGFTGIGSQEYEYSDQQLFVGMHPETGVYPSGCALMMQYMGQTFALEPLLDDDTRPEGREGTTSCQGVVNPICRGAIVDMIHNFNSTSEDSEIQCSSLIEHVNTELRSSPGSCGGEGGWISSFFNVTGGSLPHANSTVASAERLGSDECRPMLPTSYEMFKIAEMRQLFFHDPPEDAADFLGRLYGGRTGWTPVITVLYGDEEEEEEEDPEVSFLCMETFGQDGEKRVSPLRSDSGLVQASLILAAGPLVASVLESL